MLHKNGVLFLPSNIKGRDFVVGDIHGCLPALKALLKHVKFCAHSDRLISVGDLVGRGPESLEAFEFFKSSPWMYMCKGNHEDMIVRVAQGEWDPGNLVINGENWFLMLSEEKQKQIVECFENLPRAIVVGKGEPSRYNVFHAEFLGSDEELEEGKIFIDPVEKLDSILWGRTLINNKEHPVTEVAMERQNMSRSFVGHTIVGSKHLQLGNISYLDTGAFFGPVTKDGKAKPRGLLSMINPTTMELFQQHEYANQYPDYEKDPYLESFIVNLQNSETEKIAKDILKTQTQIKATEQKTRRVFDFFK